MRLFGSYAVKSRDLEPYSGLNRIGDRTMDASVATKRMGQMGPTTAGTLVGAITFGMLTFGMLTGCAGNRNSADVCANGACESIDECELGLCDDDEPLLAHASRRSSHSMAAGTLRENVSAECPFIDSEIPAVDALLDDSTIPEFRRDRRRKENYREGDDFLQDNELHEHLLSVQGALFECLDLAACYDLEAAGTGELDFQFELEPNGKVSGVSVTPSMEIDQPIVRACARRSVYESQFPSWDGSRMVVSYSVQITEGTI